MADERAQRLREQEEAAALRIDDPDSPIENLNLSVRSYNILKRMGINTVRELLQPERPKAETEAATELLKGGTPAHSLYVRLRAGSIDDDTIPDWIPRQP